MKRKHSLTYGPNTTYFVTATITEFTHLFNREPLAQIFMNNLRFYIDRYSVSLHGFVVMPNHIHLLLTIGGSGTISKFMGGLKERTAKQIIQWCEKYNENELLDVFLSSARRYKTNFRYQVWQRRFDALAIYQSATFMTKLDYIHNNPVQERWHLCDMVEDYRFSSARCYVKNEDVGVPLEVIEQTS
jgi:putative transposase